MTTDGVKAAARTGYSPRLARFERVVSLVTGTATAISAAGVLIALALVSYGVVMRYVFNRAPAWVDDMVGFMLVGIVMLGAATTLRHGAHISVDILTARLDGRARRAADAWAMLCVLAFSIVVIVNGWQTAMSSRMLGVVTSGTIEIPVYWLQLLMPAGGLLLLAASIEALLRLWSGIPVPHETPLDDAQ